MIGQKGPRMTAVIHKISLGAGGNTLSPLSEESPVEAYVLGNYAYNRSRASTDAYITAFCVHLTPLKLNFILLCCVQL